MNYLVTSLVLHKMYPLHSVKSLASGKTSTCRIMPKQIVEFDTVLWLISFCQPMQSLPAWKMDMKCWQWSRLWLGAYLLVYFFLFVFIIFFNITISISMLASAINGWQSDLDIWKLTSAECKVDEWNENSNSQAKQLAMGKRQGSRWSCFVIS